MKQVVILGAGTGGALVANLLARRLNLKEWVITIVDRSDQHVYQPGLLFLPFGLYGYADHKELVRPIGDPLPRNVNFLAADILRIDPEKKTVETSITTLRYDFMVSALGCRVAPEEEPAARGHEASQPGSGLLVLPEQPSGGDVVSLHHTHQSRLVG